MKKIDCIGVNCSECCKRYWITVLPEELKKEAKLLHLSEKKFIQKYCILHLNLFSANSSDALLSLSSVFLPKKIASALVKQNSFLPPFLLVLPSLAFKRKNGKCIFLSNKLCKIYPVRPHQCALFPFISIEKKSLGEQYPFCKGLKDEKPRVLIEKSQARKVADYFMAVEKKGFLNIWETIPGKGVVCFENRTICGISKKEFLGLIGFLDN